MEGTKIQASLIKLSTLSGLKGIFSITLFISTKQKTLAFNQDYTL
ncbi:MAG: hypothetical protein WCK98_07270 [bacterium]